MRTFFSTPAASWLVLTLLAGCGAAQATAIRSGAGPAPGPAPTASARGTTRAAQPAPALELVAGRIDAVDRVKGTLTLSGRTVELHASRLQIFHADGSGRAGIEALRAGTPVRFALEPGAAEPRRIVLVYIEKNP